MTTPDVKRGHFSPPSVFDLVDLLIEILLRLPVKSLIRFQIVSKLWLSIISDSRFQTKHTLHRRKCFAVTSGLYFRSEEYGGFSLTGDGSTNGLPSLGFLGSGFQVQQHCNGLLLCRNRKKLIVCNPTTKKYRQFSIPNDMNASSIRACLAFDPSKSVTFKVVVPASTGLAIFSSDTSSWTHVHIASTTSAPFEPSMLYGAVFCDGAVFWRQKGISSLFRFDMSSYQLSLTPCLLLWNNIHYVGECRGRLTLLVSSTFGNYELVMPEIDEEAPNAWIVKSYINVKPVGLLGKGGRIVVMAVSSDATGEDFKVLVAFADRVHCYSWKVGTTNVLFELPPTPPKNSNSFSYRNVYSFAESLVPV